MAVLGQAQAYGSLVSKQAVKPTSPCFYMNQLSWNASTTTRSKLVTLEASTPAPWSHVRYLIERKCGLFSQSRGACFMTGRLVGDFEQTNAKMFVELQDTDIIGEESIILIRRYPKHDKLLHYVPEAMLEQHEQWLQDLTAKTRAAASRSRGRVRRELDMRAFCSNNFRFIVRGTQGPTRKHGDYGHASNYMDTPPKWLKCDRCESYGHYDSECTCETVLPRGSASSVRAVVDSDGHAKSLPSRMKFLSGIPHHELTKIDKPSDSGHKLCLFDNHGNFYVRKETIVCGKRSRLDEPIDSRAEALRFLSTLSVQE